MKPCFRQITVFIIMLFALLKPAYADEAIVRVANMDNRVLETYLGSGFNIFSRNEIFSGYLGQALTSGIVDKYSGLKGKRYISKTALVKRELQEAAQDIKSLLPFKARVSGKKRPGTGSAWEKYILNFPANNSCREGIFEITADNNTYTRDKVSCIAVKNDQGAFVMWRLGDMFSSDTDPANRALRMKRDVFLQQLWRKTGFEWLMSLIPENETIAVIVLEQSSQNGSYNSADSVFLIVRPENEGGTDRRLTDISIVIGWDR